MSSSGGINRTVCFCSETLSTVTETSPTLSPLQEAVSAPVPASVVSKQILISSPAFSLPDGGSRMVTFSAFGGIGCKLMENGEPFTSVSSKQMERVYTSSSGGVNVTPVG